MKRAFVFFILSVLAVLAACAQSPAEPVACTADAKLCPDGSAVGRVLPDCAFAPCPGETASTAACAVDSDCVPAECCHAARCVPKAQAPQCEGLFCTMECRPGTMDCGGGCSCEQQKCVARDAEGNVLG